MKEKEEFNFTKAKQGAVTALTSNKKRITIRLDESTIEWFRKKVHEAGGGNYQTFINDALKEYISFHEGALESSIRKIIREELKTKYSDLGQSLEAIIKEYYHA